MAGQQEKIAVQPEKPKFTTVGARIDDSRKSVSVVVHSGGAPGVYLRTAGTLTGLFIDAGAAIKNGERLASVDGHDILAFQGDAPLYRDLSMGDAGADVHALSQYLADIGFSSAEGIGSDLDSSMRGLITEFQKSIHANPDGIFRIDYVAYIPQAASTVGHVSGSVGDFVSTDYLLLNALPIPTEVAFTALSEGDSLASLAGKSLELAIGGETLPVDGLNVRGDDVGKVAAFLSTAAGPGHSVAGDDAATGYDGALLRLAHPTSWGTVPMTALYSSASGELCIFLPSTNPTTAAYEIRVADGTPAAGEVGESLVSDDLVGARVVRNPATLPQEVLDQCK